MKIRPGWVFLLILLVEAGLTLRASAQETAQQQEITVIVINALPQPPQPVKAADVSLWSQDVSLQQRPTNSSGEALLHVSVDAIHLGDLRIEIAHAGDLVIYLPAGGRLEQTSGLPEKLTISLLPKGSAALLGPAQMEAMLRRSLLQANRLQKESRALKGEVAQVQNQKPDLGVAIAKWALENGFSAAQVDQQVQQWATGIQKQSEQATTEQRALAELALRHYDAAAQLFQDAGNADLKQLNSEDAQEQAVAAQAKALQAAQQGLLDKERSSLRQFLDHRRQAAGADRLNLKYREATQTLESAATTAESQYKKHADERGFHELWLQALLDAANARWLEGEVASADQSLPLLIRSADDLRSLAREYTALGDRPELAAVEMDLGNALADQGVRDSGNKSMALLDQALEAYRHALEVYTKTNLPQDWATTQNDLGTALTREGERVKGDKAMSLLDQAVEAYHHSLEVYSKTDLPQDWALVQNNLGVALNDEGERTGGDRSVALLDQAVEAYRHALEVRTNTNLPQDWAATQNNLGNELMRESEHVAGDKAVALLDQTVEAYRHALEVYSKTDLPQDWAMTQNNLGNALRHKAELASGEKATVLLGQAAESYYRSLQVYTKADMPQNWAKTQNNLGITLTREGEHAVGDKAIALLDQAVEAYRHALEVDTKADLPQDWAMTQNNLGLALNDESERAVGDKAIALLDQAVEAYRHALEVDTKADLPQDWAGTQVNLGNALSDEGERESGDKAMALLDQAVDAYQKALEVYTKADLPQKWAITQNGLGIALAHEGMRTRGDKSIALLDQAIEADRHALEIYTKADLPQDWAMTQDSLGLALENESTRAGGDKAMALLDQAVEALHHALEVYTKADRPENWATASATLAAAYSAQKKYAAAVDLYESILKVFPDSVYALQMASQLDHEFLYHFDRALEIDQHRAQLDPSAPNRMDLMEAGLTAGRFNICLQQEPLLADSTLDSSLIVIRNTLALACQWGAGDKAAALSRKKSLMSSALNVKKSGWTFTGTLHFLSESPAFASGRASWIALFTSVQNGDSAGVTAALHQLEPILQQ